jgi:prolyl-tRNA editing enzyme YbaK/EbsC (Cys-tRNA(Pro) deacylase)
MDYHPVVNKIKDLLVKNDLWFETFEHEEVKTSEEAAKIRSGYTLKQGAKAMIIRAKNNESDKKFVMLILPGDLRFNNDKVKSVLQIKDIRFATSEEISQITDGVEIGGVPPFGNLFNLEVIVDPKLFLNEKIVFNAGDRRYSIAMKSEDYQKLIDSKIMDIT